MQPRTTEVEARPIPALQPHVEAYVGFDLRGFPPGIHVGTPSRSLTAVVSLAEPLEVAAGVGTDARVELFASVASGLMSRSVAIRHDGTQWGVLISLTPFGARAIYGMPASKLVDQRVGLDELLGVWHVVDMNGPSCLLSITSTAGTEHRPRTGEGHHPSGGLT